MNNRNDSDTAEIGYALLKAVMDDKIFSDKFKVVSKLVKANAPLNRIDANGNGVLHHAVMSNHPRMVAFLIEHGADITVTNNLGQTPIQLAAHKNRWDCVNAFALNKQDENCEGGYGYALLRAVKADKYATATNLLKAKASLNWTTRDDRNGVLQLAVLNNHPRMLSALLTFGADPAYKNKTGKTASQLAADQHRWDCAHFIAVSVSDFGLWKRKQAPAIASSSPDITPTTSLRTS